MLESEENDLLCEVRLLCGPGSETAQEVYVKTDRGHQVLE